MSQKCKYCSEYQDTCMSTCEGWQSEDKLRNQMQALMIENENLKRQIIGFPKLTCETDHRKIHYDRTDDGDPECPLCRKIEQLHGEQDYRNEWER